MIGDYTNGAFTLVARYEEVVELSDRDVCTADLTSKQMITLGSIALSVAVIYRPQLAVLVTTVILLLP